MFKTTNKGNIGTPGFEHCGFSGFFWTNEQAGIRGERGYGGESNLAPFPINLAKVHLRGILPYPWFPLYPYWLVSLILGERSTAGKLL